MRIGTMLFGGFIAALCVHVALGNGIDVILEDVIRGVLVMLLFPAGYFFYMLVCLLFFVNKDVYERNRQATILARKYNRGRMLSEAEQLEVKRLVDAGILEHRGIAYTVKGPGQFIRPLYLTDRAIDAVWH